ncbi:MAG: 50S ribosomal protein L11 methyltransferase [Ruminococcus sp.]|nr:50S ribosomal protein L11 methyltransferase [Ruminococcus sp.]
MEWIEVNIYTATAAIELLTAKLLDIGVKGFVIQDAEDFSEFLENKNGQWDYIDEDLLGLSSCETCMTIYLPDNSQGADMLTSVRSMLAELKASDPEGCYGRLEAELSSIREEDWANNWKQYFKPIKVGDRLIIKPSWEELDDPGERAVLEIDPASSFGTGQHHTTRLCLELLEKSIAPGDRVLDLGCGSGILSIGAMLLGASEAAAVDIDQNAAETAAEHAAKNGISPENYKTYYGNILSDEDLAAQLDGSYDIITANIVADVLIAMRGYFTRYLRKGGTLIVSGIIEERMEEVLTAIESEGFTRGSVNIKDGWAAAAFKA